MSQPDASLNAKQTLRAQLTAGSPAITAPRR